MISEPHHPAGQYGLAEERQPIVVDRLPRTCPHGETFCLEQGLEIGLKPFQRSLALRGAEFCFDFPKPGSVLRQTGLFEGPSGSCECRQLSRRDRNEAAERVRVQAPVLPVVI